VPDTAVPDEAVKDLGRDFRIRLTGFKPYAACRGIHSSIDVMLGLRGTRQLRAAAVKTRCPRMNCARSFGLPPQPRCVTRRLHGWKRR
jgi:hypothetical protein